MRPGNILLSAFMTSLVIMTAAWDAPSGDEVQLPAFGRGTILVWKTQSQTYTADFVIRIAEFLPDRYMEWEDFQTQGTVFIPSREIQESRGYESDDFFKSGVDTRAKDATTLWLSRRIYLELKTKKKIKMDLDGVQGVMTVIGSDQVTLEVNKSKMALPVIKVKDDRGSERWFLDLEENPLLVKHAIGAYDQSLTSIMTNKPDSLRFIKGRKLTNLPR
jgi:hypothetical protein